MAISKADLGARVRALRQFRGLTQSTLASSVEGLDQTKLSRIENGERGLTSLELADVAEALEVDPSHLIEEYPLPESIQVAARSEVTNSPEACEAAVRRGETLARARRVLTDAGFPKPIVTKVARPRLQGKEIDKGRKLADWVRATVGNEVDPIDDLVQFVEDNFGLAVAVEPFGRQFDGLLIFDRGAATALINSTNYLHRQRFTLAHELCHLLSGDGDGLHMDRDILFQAKGSRAELRANAFAAALLLPLDALASRSQALYSLEGAAALGFQYGVSKETLAWQLKNSQLADDAIVEKIHGSSALDLARLSGRDYEHDRNAMERYRDYTSAALAASTLQAYDEAAIGSGLVADLLGLEEWQVEPPVMPVGRR